MINNESNIMGHIPFNVRKMKKSLIKNKLNFSLNYIMPNLPQHSAQLTPTPGQVGHFDQCFWKFRCGQSIYLFSSNQHDYIGQDPKVYFYYNLDLQI